MKIAPLKQPDEDACGPTCLLMVSDYFNLGFYFTDVKTLTNYQKEGGMSDVEMESTLKLLGLNAKLKTNTTWETLRKYNTADVVIIVSYMLEGYIGHFSVVNSVTDEAITLADPLTGTLRTYGKIHFLRLWMSYDEKWYPKKNIDITLRTICVAKR